MDKDTVKQAMQATINLLEEVPVPVGMIDNIAMPIRAAINNMWIGLKALNDPDEEKPEETEDTKDGNVDAG